MAEVKINGQDLPFVHVVDTVSGGRSFVRCLTENEQDQTALYDLLKDYEEKNAEFDMISNKGYFVHFEGKIIHLQKQNYETDKMFQVSFTAEPTGNVIIK